MDEVDRRLSEWLAAELAELPPGITAVYVEHGGAASPGSDRLDVRYVDAFGFQDLDIGAGFDPEDEAHLAQLGDFDWQAGRVAEFDDAAHPEVDWTDAVARAADAPEVTAILSRRGLRVLAGEHDSPVRVLR
jgi:hypothetical protein